MMPSPNDEEGSVDSGQVARVVIPKCILSFFLPFIRSFIHSFILLAFHSRLEEGVGF
jgi:hypothetical protein